MATIEKNGELTYVDENGNEYVLHPKTKIECVEGLEETIEDTNAQLASKRPNTWMPTASDVGAVPTTRKVNGKALSTNITLSASDVGAAPAGLHRCYGSLKDIGITTFPTTMSAVANAMPANSMIVIDTRRINSGGTEEISDWGNESNGTAYINRGYSVARVTMAIFYGSGSSVKGRLYVGSYASETNTVGWTDYGYDGIADYPSCFYRTVDGVAEWINPPMIAGTEYRTAERYNGRVVYAQLVSLGNMPNNTVKNTTFKPTNVVDRISCEVMMQLASANHTETCPAIGNTISDIETMATWLGNNTDSVIRVTTSQDRSKYKGFALCKYTKG